MLRLKNLNRSHFVAATKGRFLKKSRSPLHIDKNYNGPICKIKSNLLSKDEWKERTRLKRLEKFSRWIGVACRAIKDKKCIKSCLACSESKCNQEQTFFTFFPCWQETASVESQLVVLWPDSLKNRAALTLI